MNATEGGASFPHENIPRFGRNLKGFLAQHEDQIIGVTQGFDRLRLQGTLRSLYNPEGMAAYLQKAHVLWKDFKQYTTGLTQRMREGVEALARNAKRPVIYLPSSHTRKETVAKEIASRDGIDQGIVAVLSCVETCHSYRAMGNRATKKLELRLQETRCIHLYVYLIDKTLGFLHLRLQTWFPFLVQLCINGREWLARELIKAGVRFQRRDNALPWLEDPSQAQRLMDQQLKTNWVDLCEGLLGRFQPLKEEILRPLSLNYYWTIAESEYATDVMFKDRESLAKLYPGLVRFGMQGLQCGQVLRFLSKRPEVFQGEACADCRRRVEGVRLKHWANSNSLKMYDKGSIFAGGGDDQRSQRFQGVPLAGGQTRSAQGLVPAPALNCGRVPTRGPIPESHRALLGSDELRAGRRTAWQ